MYLNESADRLQYHVLKSIAESDAPLGAGAVSEALRKRGHSISEAAAGRALRSIRNEGFLEKVGFQGHVLTKMGMERLHSLEIRLNVRDALLRSLRDADERGEAYLCEALLALRSLAHEMVGEAIKWAKNEDIEVMEDIIAQYKGGEGLEVGHGIFSDFYRQLLRMSKIPMFEHFFNILEASVMGHVYLASLFKRAEKTIGESFDQVLDAIRERQSATATETVNAQIDSIIHFVQSNTTDGD